MSKIEREVVRKVFRSSVEELRSALESKPDAVEIKKLSQRVDRHLGKLTSLDQAISEELNQRGTTSTEEYEQEYVSTSSYLDEYEEIIILANKFLKICEEDDIATQCSNVSKKKKCGYRLPQLRLKKFGGDPKDWISFWSQFKSIHEDDEMSVEEKFNYLLDTMVEHSPAWKVVNSFPPSVENYPKALEHLKSRFGNDEILVEVYVRELLGLVLMSQKKNETLANLYDKLETQLRALESLGVTTDKYGAMLFPLVESSLPVDTLRVWERTRVAHGEEKVDKLNQLMLFLKQEVDGEERIRMAQTFSRQEKFEERPKDRKKILPTTTDLYYGNNDDKCVYCEKIHNAFSCDVAKDMDIAERRKVVSSKGACFNCLRRGHQARKCLSKKSCMHCKGRHHTSLCLDSKEGTGKVVKTLSNHYSSEVLMMTLTVVVEHGNEARKVRALIDTGSQSSYITKEAATVLGLEPIDNVTVLHDLFGGHGLKQMKHKIFDVHVRSLDNSAHFKLRMMDQEIICGNVTRVPQGKWIEEFIQKRITFTDVGNDCPKIHLLFGADVAGNLMTGKVVSSGSGPVAVNTRLGWTVMGKLPLSVQIDSPVLVSLFNSNFKMETLWSLDTIGIQDPIQVDKVEKRLEMILDKFNRTTTINSEGRYEVELPWIVNHPPVADNFELAKQRLLSATRKLRKLEKLNTYGKMFSDWESRGIIEKVSQEDFEGTVSYLPHHPVFNPNSETTPCRPVFDASASSNKLPSLNDCLETGPNLIEEVPAILSRFRLGAVGLVSDIKKAFLQISVKKEDRRCLRFLWWGENGEMITFQHCRVVFGVSSSPFLLAATLGLHLEKYVNQDFVSDIRSSLYVDNILPSVDSLERGKEFMEKTTSILLDGKFELHDWITSGAHDGPDFVGVLGMKWNPVDDYLYLDLDDMLKPVDLPITKRKILSAAHRVFDPLGFAAPVTLLPKLMLQELWSKKLDWNEEVPPDMAKKFMDWISALSHLAQVRIPRHMILGTKTDGKLQLHTFTDASKAAYAACVFIRSEYNGKVCCQLVMAKSRIAPKNATIPRLELLGCLVGARLATAVIKYLKLSIDHVYFWTDSANALYWIQNQDTWTPFIFNRVREINLLTKAENWRHVSGKLNPADLPSRGCTARQLLETAWWEGPNWLYDPEESWPVSEINVEMKVVLAEKKKTFLSTVNVEANPWYMSRFSDYPKIVRLFGWLLRWKKLVKKEVVRRKYITNEEYNEAELLLFRIVQSEAYGQCIKTYKNLGAMGDTSGLYRIKTRITNRVDSMDFLYPIVLPHNHPLTFALILHEHKRLLHVGVSGLLRSLREKLWITKARQVAKKVVQKCIKCRRHQGKQAIQQESALPLERVRDAEVFEVVGVDLGGLLYLRDGSKVWFAIFTCAVYRAVHLEVVSSLSTEDFAKCFRRFVARRGRPTIGIVWKFNPPSAPWWGGFWERLVGVVKTFLKKNIGKAAITREELDTLLCDVEYVINNRPLTYVNEEIESPLALTPAMFFFGVKSSGVPDLDHIDLGSMYGNRRIRALDLKRRFRDEYLSIIKSGSKKEGTNLNVGDIVFVINDQQKRTFWPLGLIVELIAGRDGVRRVAKVKTSSGIMTRPIQRLVPLEINANVEEGIGSAIPGLDQIPGFPVDQLESPEVDTGALDLAGVITTRSGRVVNQPIRFS